MQSRKQVRKMKQQQTAKKALTTSALALGISLGLGALGTNKASAATWTANSVASIQAALKSNGTTPYTIQWGDTLSTIAAAANQNGLSTTVDRLTEINHISNKNLIFAGNKLWFNATNNTVTATDKAGNNHTYNLDANKPVQTTPNQTGSTKPATPNKPGNNTNTGNTKPTTPNKPGNGSDNNNTKPSKPGDNGNTKPTEPNKPGNGGDNGGTVTPPNNGGETTPPDNGGGEVTPPKNNIYTPDANHIKELVMSKIDLSKYNKYWGEPTTPKAPSGVDWEKSTQEQSGYGNSVEFRSDEGIANYIVANFDDYTAKDYEVVSMIVGSISVTGSIDLDNPAKGMINFNIVYNGFYDPLAGIEM